MTPEGYYERQAERKNDGRIHDVAQAQIAAFYEYADRAAAR